MTAKELIDRLQKMNPDKVVVITDGQGWSNIEKVEQHKITIEIAREEFPVFSEN